MTCPNCRAPLAAGALVCADCGYGTSAAPAATRGGTAVLAVLMGIAGTCVGVPAGVVIGIVSASANYCGPYGGLTIVGETAVFVVLIGVAIRLFTRKRVALAVFLLGLGFGAVLPVAACDLIAMSSAGNCAATVHRP